MKNKKIALENPFFVFHFLACLVLSQFNSRLAFAGQNNSHSTQVSQTSKTARPPATPMVSGFFQMARSTNLYEPKDGVRRDGVDYTARLVFKLNEKLNLRFDGGFAQDLKMPESNDMNDMAIALVRTPIRLSRFLMLGYNVSTIAAISRESRINLGLKSALGGALSLSLKPECVLGTLAEGLSLAAAISLKRNIHEYDTAADGAVGSQYTSAQVVSTAYQFSSGIGLSMEYVHKNGLTYQNNLKESFEISEEISYSLTEMITAALGHSNAGNALKSNGQDSNFALINPETSIYYGSLNLTF
jgi:hypothetical protein